ncbi:MAG: tRNA nucleotidyltransferase [Clostridia bacterium]|nr:tRNA nucleotidyltransferase [Clostridia bacterium]
MSEYEKDLETAQIIAQEVKNIGGRAFYVGGFVRDKLMGVSNKDIDIEVHGVTTGDLENILDRIGGKITIGESFGVYGLKGHSLDIAMPRKEEMMGRGHRDFNVCVNPFLGTRKAAMRRDFTINALMQDVLTGEIVDEFNGRIDLEKRVIRHINDKTFVEDPLRVLRGAQFASRFGFEIAEETIELCKTMDLSYLAKERVIAELEKALLKADKPSVFFEFLRKTNQLSVWFGELEALIGIQQNPLFHLEGDVWVHTMMVLDEAVKYRDKVSNPLGFMMSAITHDFGKAICTEIINGVIHSYNHETKGLPLVESFMKRLTNETKLIEYVLNLSKHHMKPNVLAFGKSSVKSTNKLFDKAIDPEALIYLSASDSSGKISSCNHVSNVEFLTERLEIFKEYMSRPYVMGRDLIEAGLHPNEKFAEYLEYAHKLRLAGVEKESALKQTLSFARKGENK